MAQKINGKPSLVASLAASIKRNLEATGEAADRIMAGTPEPGDLALLRTGERCIALLRQRAVS